jgi:hypothetical protein
VGWNRHIVLEVILDGVRDRRRGAGVTRWILGEVRRIEQRLPARVGGRGIVAIAAAGANCGHRTPEPEVKLRVPACDESVGECGECSRREMRARGKIERLFCGQPPYGRGPNGSSQRLPVGGGLRLRSRKRNIR